MPLAVNFPAWLKPEIIPGLPFRWYGLMYLFAFAAAYLLFMRQAKERSLKLDEETLSGLFFWTILGLLVGARVFATIVYDTSGIYLRKPWLVFWPFDGGRFTGLQGMSYHGGAIGATAAIILYCRAKRLSFREIGDLMAASIPFAYTFGRLGNFINGELYGRVTASGIGMIFPNAQRLSTKEPWVRSVAEAAGIPLAGGEAFVNLPRHPSQLYEALFEGIVLGIVLWVLRKRKPFKGFMIGAYIAGYGFVRFFIEYFREPDADLGYRLEFVKTGIPPALYSTPFAFSTGQLLCFLMMVGGLGWIAVASRLSQEDAKAVPTPAAVEKAHHERNARRKLRKKLK